jgi:hypothetical protein
MKSSKKEQKRDGNSPIPHRSESKEDSASLPPDAKLIQTELDDKSYPFIWQG